MNYSIKPPQSIKKRHIIKTHGQERQDNYFWLRDDKWPDVKNKNIISHLKAENEYTSTYFANHKKLEEQLFVEMKSRIKEEDTSYPIKNTAYYYYSKTKKDKDYLIYCRKKNSTETKEEVLLDVNNLASGHESFTLGAFKVSHEKNFLAYSYDQDGQERYKIIVKDLESHNIIDSSVCNAIGDIIWHKSKNGFFYLKLDKNWRHKEVYFHQLSTTQDHDVVIYAEQDDMFSVNIMESSDKKLLLISSSSSTSNEFRYLDFDSQLNNLKTLIPRKEKQIYDLDHGHQSFYVKINDLGQNFRLAKFSAENAENKCKWEEIIKYKQHSYIT